MNTQNVNTAAQESTERYDEHTEMLFCRSGKKNIWDFAQWSEGKGYTGKWSKKTLQQLQAEEPDMVMMSYQEYQESLKTHVSEISEEKFIDMLEVLPPLGWQGYEGRQSFKLSEMYSEKITHIYAQIGKRYFQFRDYATLSHREIIEKIINEMPGLIE